MRFCKKTYINIVKKNNIIEDLSPEIAIKLKVINNKE